MSTIAAISTPLAAGGIGVIRISGESALQIAAQCFRPASGKPVSEMRGYSAAYGVFYDETGEIDDGVLDYMIVPKAGLLRILTQLPRLYNGTVNESGLLVTGRCAVLEMTGDNSVEMDGEVIGRLPLKITMTGSQICVPVGS